MDIYFALQSDSDGTPLLNQAANTTVYISKDGGSYAATTNAVAEIGRGSYKVTLTSAEATFTDVLLYQPVCTGAQINTLTIDKKVSAEDNANAVWGAPNKEITGTVTINSTQAGTFATSADLTTVGNNVSAIKAKTDNLPAEPAAVGSAMTLTSATITSVKDGLATGSGLSSLASHGDTYWVTANVSGLATGGGLEALANYGDAHWSTADLSDVSTFDPSTDAVTLTDAYDAAKTASQLTTDDLSALATSEELTALASVANDTLAGMLYWRVVDDTLITYGSNGSIRGQYTITKDSTGNIIKIEPILSNDAE